MGEPSNGCGAEQLVGDPIDVITGANVDGAQDFVVAEPRTIRFVRHYSSAWSREDRGLGPGFRHSYDHRLHVDLDGFRYDGPEGASVAFPFLWSDGDVHKGFGYVLRRQSAQLYVLELPDRTRLEMDAVDPRARTLRPARIVGRESTVACQYDADGRLVQLDDDRGRTVVFLWGDGRLVEARFAGLSVARYRYDDRGRLVAVEDAYRHGVRLAYDDANRVVQRTDRRGYSFFFEYDDAGRCVRSRGEDGLFDVALAYSPQDRRTSVTRGDGGVWHYTYDDAGGLISIVDAYGKEKVFVRRPSDCAVVETIDEAGRLVTTEYDDAGRWAIDRDAAGRIVRADEGHRVPWNARQFEHGDSGDQAHPLPDAAVLASLVAPEIAAALVTATSADEGVVREVRDPQGLLVRREGAGLPPRRYGYDSNGNLRWWSDFDGAKRERAHASFDQIAHESDGNGLVTSFGHSREDKLVAVVDPGGTRTDYERDLRGNTVALWRGGAVVDRYERDGAGLLARKLDASGQPLYAIVRGPQGEVLERRYASGGFERRTYDGDLRLVEAATADAVATFAYDGHGRRIEDKRDGLGVEHRFGPLGLRETRVLDRFVVRYERARRGDEASARVIDPTGRSHSVRAAGHGIFERRWANGSVETSQYHARGYCLAKVVSRAGDTHVRWTRRYVTSGEGYLLERHDSQRGRTRFGHDAGHRLVEEKRPDGASFTYAHDPAGNLLASPTSSATYAAANTLVEANGRRFSHDARQAIATEQGAGVARRFHRDERDQLVAVSYYVAGSAEGKPSWVPTATWLARYDGLNRRIEKGFPGATTRMYWDTDRLAAEVLPTGAVRVYVYEDAFAPTPFLFVDYASLDADPASGAVYAVFADHLGCPERIEDLEGQTVWSARIDPYGLAHVEVGAELHQPLRWPGHYWDAELQLSYNRFRTYSPELGRYLEPDPTGVTGLVGNVYQYTRNPLRHVDVDGLCPNADESEEERKKREQEEKEDDASEGNQKKKSTGADLAAENNLPPAPDGYHWANVGGEPVLKANPGSGNPPMHYDEAAGAFAPRPDNDGYNRVSFTDKERKAVYDASPKDDNGKAICPCGEPIESHHGGDMDMGHQPGHKFSEARDEARRTGQDPAEFRADQKDLNNYRAEHPSCNRSHEHE